MLRMFVRPQSLGAIALAVGMLSIPARADVVVLKDGFTIHGVRLAREKTEIIDEKFFTAIQVDKPGGVTAVDDNVRWVVFPTSLKQLADVSEANKFKDFTAYTKDAYLNAGRAPFPNTLSGKTEVMKDWDPKTWTRTTKLFDKNPTSFHKFEQHINNINPYYVRIGSASHQLTRFFLTKEFPPDVLRKFLSNHPNLAETDGKPDAAKRERFIRFWIQAEMLDEADKDINALLKALPEEQERCAKLRAEINALRIDLAMTEIERARTAGRHQWVTQALTTFPKVDLPKAVAVKLTELRAEYESTATKFASVRKHLLELAKQAPADQSWLIDAASAVRNEVHPDTLPRLEVFMTLADRAEKDVAAGRKVSHSPAELLAAAISGWHLGKVSAEPKPELAQRCWIARQMCTEYFRNVSPVERANLLQVYQASAAALKYDELEKLVSLLPPPDAPAQLPVGVTPQTLPASPEVPKGMDYLIRLPDEYHPGRSYPLLVALPDGSFEEPVDVLNRLGDYPNRFGYIVAVPKWQDALGSNYNYTTDERNKALMLVRHLKRTYQVDSDRVFLWGHGEGGAMALDLGSTRPDLWAGIVPMNPTVYPKAYIAVQAWVNYCELPVYLIMGDRAAASVVGVRAFNERWMKRGYPTLVVSYKGRGTEWFGQELPFAFDWMSRKRRPEPSRQLGPPKEAITDGPGYTTVRSGPARFGWLSAESIHPSRLMEPVLGGNAPSNGPARFYGVLAADTNAVDVRIVGAPIATIWFGKGMLDYSKPVSITANGKFLGKKTIVPKVSVLMEDLYQRADRQRPYFEQFELKLQ